MRLIECPLQKLAQSKYQGEIYFASIQEAAEVLSRKHPYAKVLFLLSVNTADQFTKFEKLFPSAVVRILFPTGGVESLFSLPDDLSLVLCYGEDYVLCAARYFAEVRNLPCGVFAYNADTACLCSRAVEVCVGGDKSVYPAKNADFLFVNECLLQEESLLPVYVDILSLRVALFEAKFNALILQSQYDKELYEAVFLAVSACGETSFACMQKRKLFCASLLVSLCAAAGFLLGEVKLLAQSYKNLGAGALAGYYAMEKLSKVYHVFFHYGKYRKYYTPPYHARIKQASGLYKKSEEELSGMQILPPVESLALYAQVFENVRARFLCDAQELLRRTQWLEDNIKEYKADFLMENKLLNAALKYLPEGNSNYGLTSLMRDFGLLDF